MLLIIVAVREATLTGIKKGVSADASAEDPAGPLQRNSRNAVTTKTASDVVNRRIVNEGRGTDSIKTPP